MIHHSPRDHFMITQDRDEERFWMAAQHRIRTTYGEDRAQSWWNGYCDSCAHPYEAHDEGACLFGPGTYSTLEPTEYAP